MNLFSQTLSDNSLIGTNFVSPRNDFGETFATPNDGVQRMPVRVSFNLTRSSTIQARVTARIYATNSTNPNFAITNGRATYTTSGGTVCPAGFFPSIPLNTWAQITVTRVSGVVTLYAGGGSTSCGAPDNSFSLTGVNIFDRSFNTNVEYFDDFSISGTV